MRDWRRTAVKMVIVYSIGIALGSLLGYCHELAQ